jgi:DNA repair photolyase
MAKTKDSSLQEQLFPILSSANEAQSKGIAKFAAESSVVDSGHLVEYRDLKTRSILNDSTSKRMIFSKAINPYRGCEFGCRYCYARYTHEFMEIREPEKFEQIIFIKQNAAWMLRQELSKVGPGEEIAIGTATDPYQPIERRAEVTRSLLEVIAEKSGLRIGIVTKSTLIQRDIDLLCQISQENELTVHLTITTSDPDLARILEPRAPRPDLRLKTVKRLREAGLLTGILCSPILPGITDTLTALSDMAAKAHEADASFFYAQPLFLKPCSKTVFLDFLRLHFPALVPSYEQRFQESAFVSLAYKNRIRNVLETVCKAHGLNQRQRERTLIQNFEVPPSQKGTTQSCLWQKEPRREHEDIGVVTNWGYDTL